LPPGLTFDDTKSFARAVAELFEREDPERVTSNMKKALRKDKVFIDWSQNDEHKTTVCAYSLRARPRPTVSTPVTWKELEAAFAARDPSGLVFEARDVLARVKRRGDLFASVLTLKQKLPRF
jgi:bifunctional non-homologous end joining protein LigD